MLNTMALLKYNYLFALVPFIIRLAIYGFVYENKYHIKWMARYTLALFIGGILLIPAAIYEIIEYLWPYAFPAEENAKETTKTVF